VTPSEIERLVAAIDDDPDSLHGDRTPAVDALVAHGLAALGEVLPLLEHAPELTRLRAQRVLEGVTLAWVRERVKENRPLTRSDTRAWQELWTANGAYDWQGTPDERRASVARWRAWLSGRVR
jgi:hypothetical protein